ncbi:MAG: citrate lyase subunit alpha [Thermoplasmatota archaeon]
MDNSLGRDLPEQVAGRTVQPYQGPVSFRPTGRRYGPPLKAVFPGESKVLGSLREAIIKTGLSDGATISFHHHLRNGEAVVNMVVGELARLGLKDITLAPTALFPVHEPLIEHVTSGVVTAIHGSLNGPVGAFASPGGVFKEPTVLRSHGGRARALASGDLHVDVAFISAPIADDYGNCNGAFGGSAFGAMGFPAADARYADQVVVVTDNLQPYPVTPASISQTQVDYVVQVDSIGDPQGIKTGTMEITKSPSRLMMAQQVVRLLAEADIITDGFSFQAGAGGTSLAVTKFLHDYMRQHHITGKFVMGGITGFVVDMLEDGTISTILDAQSFDLRAVESIRRNPRHVEVSHIEFGDPHTGGCVVNRQQACFLGATEVDVDFNVNVNTHSDGMLLHGIGGHQDAAAGSDVTIILAPLLRGRIPVVRDRVTTVSTPGDVVDVIVTDQGIAVNPRRDDLLESLRGSHLNLVDINDLYARATRLCGEPRRPVLGDEVVAVVEYRDGTVLDTVHSVRGW